jgi:hypothetical protein
MRRSDVEEKELKDREVKEVKTRMNDGNEDGFDAGESEHLLAYRSTESAQEEEVEGWEVNELEPTMEHGMWVSVCRTSVEPAKCRGMGWR